MPLKVDSLFFFFSLTLFALFLISLLPSSLSVFRVWWEKSTAAFEFQGRWNLLSLRWSWTRRWRPGWTHTSWKSGTAGMKTLCHPHTTSNPKPKCWRTTRTLWVPQGCSKKRQFWMRLRQRRETLHWLWIFMMCYFSHVDILPLLTEGFNSADNGFWSWSWMFSYGAFLCSPTERQSELWIGSDNNLRPYPNKRTVIWTTNLWGHLYFNRAL